MDNTIILINEIPLMRTTMKITLENRGYKILGVVESIEEYIEKYSMDYVEYVTVELSSANKQSIDKLKDMYKHGLFKKVLAITFDNGLIIKELVFADENTFIIRPYMKEGIVNALERL